MSSSLTSSTSAALLFPEPSPIFLNDLAVGAVYQKCIRRSNEKGAAEISLHALNGAGVSFHLARINENRSQIAGFLRELPKEFRAEHGGSQPFMRIGKHAVVEDWTTDWRVMEKLALLAIACGYGEFPVPRHQWREMPDRKPLFTVTLPPRY